METEQPIGWARAGFHILFHIIGVLLVVVCQLEDADTDTLLVVCSLLVVSVEIFMITGFRAENRNPASRYARAFRAFYRTCAHGMVRSEELGKFTAMMSYVAGLLVIRFVFQLPMLHCLYAMAILSWGDPFGRIGGMFIGGQTLPGCEKKTWAGSMSFVLVASAALAGMDAVVYMTGTADIPVVLIAAQYVAVLVGALTEAYAPSWDNFFIAVTSALTLEGALLLLG